MIQHARTPSGQARLRLANADSGRVEARGTSTVVVAGLVPVTSIIPALCLKSEIAGTGPAMTPPRESILKTLTRLLDGRQQPRAAMAAPERPGFNDLLRPALDNPPTRTVNHRIVERKPRRNGRIVGAALAPSLGKIALQELDIGDAVDDAATRILCQVLREIGHHFGRGMGSQRTEILVAVRGLNFAEQALERIIVGIRDAHIIAALTSASTACALPAAQTQGPERARG